MTKGHKTELSLAQIAMAKGHKIELSFAKISILLRTTRVLK